MTVTMFDTITLETVPPNPQAVAGYVGGRWPTYIPLVHAFPHAHHLSIAVFASEDAECLDCEPGDASPDQVPDWVLRQTRRGVKRPVVYCSVSAVSTVVSVLKDSGIARWNVRIWSAHYTGSPHLCSPTCGFGMPTTADATQWTDRALGRNLDESLCADSFFDHPAPQPDPRHYGWFDTGPFPYGKLRLSERAVVEEYDRLRRHPHLHFRRLHVLRDQLRFLADRVYHVAHEGHGRPTWGAFHRGWRYQGLIRRSHGERLA